MSSCLRYSFKTNFFFFCPNFGICQEKNMQVKLELIDWAFIFGFFIISLLIGVISSKKAGKNFSEFFLSGRNMPWWLLGVSMVATTFATDTPNLVTDFVRQNGVAGNWAWWAFLLTGMLTVFVYAKLWRRSGVLTDIEFLVHPYQVISGRSYGKTLTKYVAEEGPVLPYYDNEMDDGKQNSLAVCSTWIRRIWRFSLYWIFGLFIYLVICMIIFIL